MQTEVCGEVFPAGTVLSVPSYSIHRLKNVWGDDADEYRPERWLVSEEKSRELEKALNIFSYGPRSCVGRNVAMMELFCFISTLNYRYDFVLAEPEKGMPTVEGFLRKCVRSLSSLALSPAHRPASLTRTLPTGLPASSWASRSASRRTTERSVPPSPCSASSPTSSRRALPCTASPGSPPLQYPSRKDSANAARPSFPPLQRAREQERVREPTFPLARLVVPSEIKA